MLGAVCHNRVYALAEAYLDVELLGLRPILPPSFPERPDPPMPREVALGCVSGTLACLPLSAAMCRSFANACQCWERRSDGLVIWDPTRPEECNPEIVAAAPDPGPGPDPEPEPEPPAPGGMLADLLDELRGLIRRYESGTSSTARVDVALDAEPETLCLTLPVGSEWTMRVMQGQTATIEAPDRTWGCRAERAPDGRLSVSVESGGEVARGMVSTGPLRLLGLTIEDCGR